MRKGNKGKRRTSAVSVASRPHDLCGIQKEFFSRFGMHIKARLVYGIFLKYFVIKQKIRPVKSDVIKPSMGMYNILKFLGKMPADISSETIMGISSRHQIHPPSSPMTCPVR